MVTAIIYNSMSLIFLEYSNVLIYFAIDSLLSNNLRYFALILKWKGCECHQGGKSKLSTLTEEEYNIGNILKTIFKCLSDLYLFIHCFYAISRKFKKQRWKLRKPIHARRESEHKRYETASLSGMMGRGAAANPRKLLTDLCQEM